MTRRQDQTEELLISACLAPEGAFVDAVRRFESDGSLDDLNEGTLRLIPYLYRRLEKAQITTRNLGILKGIYARYWYVHHMFRAPLLQECFDALEGIPFLVLKGRAFQSLLYGNDYPTRPSDDLDIIVQPENRRDAYQRFLKAGFQPKFPRHVEEIMMLGPSMGLDKGELHVDLHWDLYPPAMGDHLVDRLFESSIEVSDQNSVFRTPSVTYHLLHTLIHGWGKNEISPIRWVLDAAQLIRHPALEWNLLMSEAMRCGWQGVVSLQLAKLKAYEAIAIPPHVLEGLSTKKPPVFQRIALRHPLMTKGLPKILLSLILIRPRYFKRNSLADRQSRGWFWWRSLHYSFIGVLYRLKHRLQD